MKFKKGREFWVGLGLGVCGIAALVVSMLLMGRHSKMGADLGGFELSVEVIAIVLIFLSLFLIVWGIPTMIVGVINQSVLTVRIGRKKLKRVGVIKPNKDFSQTSDAAAVRENLLKNGYVFFLESLYYYIHNKTAYICLVDEAKDYDDYDDDVHTLQTELAERIKKLRKVSFFMRAVVLHLAFNQDISQVAAMNLSYTAYEARRKSDAGVYLCFGILDAKKQNLFVASTKSITYTYGISANMNLNNMFAGLMGGKGKVPVGSEHAAKTAVKNKSENAVGGATAVLPAPTVGAASKKGCRLSIQNPIIFVFITFCLVGTVISCCGFYTIFGGGLAVGIALVAAGAVCFLCNLLAILYRRKVIIFDGEVMEKNMFRPPFVLERENAKWLTRACILDNGTIPVIVITKEYEFGVNELASKKNAKGKYIIIKDSADNRSILAKMLGQETKL